VQLSALLRMGLAEREGFYYRRYLQVPMNSVLPR